MACYWTLKSQQQPPRSLGKKMCIRIHLWNEVQNWWRFCTNLLSIDSCLEIFTSLFNMTEKNYVNMTWEGKKSYILTICAIVSLFSWNYKHIFLKFRSCPLPYSKVSRFTYHRLWVQISFSLYTVETPLEFVDIIYMVCMYACIFI